MKAYNKSGRPDRLSKAQVRAQDNAPVAALAVPHRRGDLSPADMAGLRRNTRTVLGLLFLVAVSGFVLTGMHLALGPLTILAATALLGVIYGLVLHALPNHHHKHFGLANITTAVRAALVCMIGSAFLFAKDVDQADARIWPLLAMVLIALALDGADGFIARKLAQQSDLGARFDMELDALLILFLSAAVFLLDKAGAWVLLIGAMRYLFILAGSVLPRLQRPLPPSFRRKLICVIQVGGLCLALLPFIPADVSALISSASLILLTWSFGIDSWSLLITRTSES